MTDWRLRPARDHGLPIGQRLRSTGREPGLGGLALGFAWRGLTRLYLRLVHRLEVTGREHLPAPPFVLIANHSSHLDALAIAASLPHAVARRTFALAAGDTFFASLPGAAFAAYAINALPVWRKTTTDADIDLWRARLLEDAAVLTLFPEGTRSRTGELARFRTGIGKLVAGHPIPVVPCYLDGAHAAWPPTHRFPRPGRLHLAIGPALRFEKMAPDRAGVIEVAGQCEAAVRALMPVNILIT